MEVSNTGLSKTDIEPEAAEAEWKIFRNIIFPQYHSEPTRGFHGVVTSFLVNSSLVAGFPNLAARLATIAMLLPVTTATVERSFSDMKQIKTRLRNRLGEDTLDQAMRISIEGPEKISSDSLDNS